MKILGRTMKQPPRELVRLRRDIDRLDEKILVLLNGRAEISKKIGRLKEAKGSAIYAPAREAQILRHLHRANRGPLQGDALEAVYREILSGSRKLEREVRVAYLGPEGTFTHQASLRQFGHGTRFLSCFGIPDVFAEVENGRADYGVVPVENSTEGAIYSTLDRLVSTDLKICSEIILKIRLNLLSREKDLARVRRIYSNPQVFGQCRDWLERHLPKAEQLSLPSTSLSAERVATEKASACIAGDLSASRYGLTVLASSIQDDSKNATRFLILSKEDAAFTGEDKTSLLVMVQDKPGALFHVLEPFRKNRINLTKIESRPSRLRRWAYCFFIDVDRHSQDPALKRALGASERRADSLRILGSYPKARS